ncbi:MAG: hypothetical protein D8M58_07210 [Calditrichaeota bacterium]|nr:MAG: hypothetical protein DWQ03_19280 [Calditrichota bacterium]KAA3610118.1 MAG: hypothetical protein DWQ03_19290 [Calditrichota bacterium]MBL1205169.1 hypothetical protein [Calditrichota bacterium]NOG44999.1 hypothetical protein [Calditrichota bacterium]
MERIVIVGYKPFEGKNKELKDLMKNHWSILFNEGLVSNRKSIIMEAKDGTIVEVFGWKSKEAIELAHTNEAVQKMWADYSEVCEYIPIGDIMESGELFSEFTPFDL